MEVPLNHNSDTVSVEVAFALPDQQKLIALSVPRGTTARQAVIQSGIAKDFPEFDFSSAPMGIFSQTLGSKGLPPAEEYVLEEGDRVEIYRPLIADPKEARKQRAAKVKRDRK